jgi:uncharacterized tellurite resistance protein B-like protein
VFDFFKRAVGRPTESERAPARVHSPAAPPPRTDPRYQAPQEYRQYSRSASTLAVRRQSGWVPIGTGIDIAGYRLYGGVYIGSSLPGRTNRTPDPALIDPRLPVGGRPDRLGTGLDYWPSYTRIPAASRAAYLEWLASDRNDRRTPIGYVFLYFYGMERRVLVDCREPGPARAELPAIKSEVERLLACYGDNSSFDGYARRFLGVMDFVTGLETDNNVPPAFDGEKWPTPFSLRIRLGAYSRSGTPVPAEWALAWAYFHPEIHMRTPAIRCRPEFERLFAMRYTARFGEGFKVAPNKTTVEVEYRAASSGLSSISLLTDVPDVFPLATPARKLTALIEECTEALDAYSRWLGRFPESDVTPAAASLLPAEVADPRGGPLGRFLTWVTDQLRTRDFAILDGEALAEAWTAETKTKLSRQESEALCRFLADHGVGVEPDPRLGGAGLGAGPRVLFGVDASGATHVVSKEYTAALLLLQMSAAVAIADPTSDAEQEYLVEHLGSTLSLSTAELRRLRARLELMFADRVKLTGLTTKLSELDWQQRTEIARFCLDVAAADGTVSPRETAVLTKIYKMLGVPAPGGAVGHVSNPLSLSRPAATGPVQIQPPRSASARHALPQMPAEPKPTTPTKPEPEPTKVPAFRLDAAAIAAKIAESSEVSVMLNAIFAEESDQPEPPAPVPKSASPAIEGLDDAHSALLRDLATETSWSRGALEDLCARHGLLPDGALDTLNEAALDRTGDLVVEGEDPMTINDGTLQEMLGD